MTTIQPSAPLGEKPRKRLIFTFLWPLAVLVPTGAFYLGDWAHRNGVSGWVLAGVVAVGLAIAGYYFDQWRPK